MILCYHKLSDVYTQHTCSGNFIIKLGYVRLHVKPCDSILYNKYVVVCIKIPKCFRFKTTHLSKVEYGSFHLNVHLKHMKIAYFAIFHSQFQTKKKRDKTRQIFGRITLAIVYNYLYLTDVHQSCIKYTWFFKTCKFVLNIFHDKSACLQKMVLI